MREHEKRNIIFFCKLPYMVQYYSDFDFSICSKCPVDQARGKDKIRQNELFIMLDTETSKSKPDEYHLINGRKKYDLNPNYIVAWSLSINIYGMDIVTVWGDSPDQIAPFLQHMHECLKGNRTVIYCHFLGYDFTFLRRFLFDSWGYPVKQLNTRPHYPINIEFKNGIIFRDSLILAQTGIERWAEELQAENRKAVGKWDYDRIRHQHERITDEEIEYIECDVLAGVECLAIMRRQLRCSYPAFPYTKTGIVRAAAREAGKPFSAHRNAVKCYQDGYIPYRIMENVYHGGYTHANRHSKGFTIRGDIRCYDFSSSYPFTLCTENFPCERFVPLPDTPDAEFILQNAGKFAFIFRFRANNVRLKNRAEPFPVLQLCKMQKIIDCAIDNGRVLEAGYIDLYLNEVDFALIATQYQWGDHDITECYRAMKKPLPKWLRDFIYDKYRAKCELKGGDPVEYAMSKSAINSIYGMSCQHLMMDVIEQIPETGQYVTIRHDAPEDFEAAVKKRSTFLFYAYGVWCTSYAQRNVVQYLSWCVNDRDHCALYIDTDSCYSDNWNLTAIEQYNRLCRAKLAVAGYDPVIVNGHEYVLGTATLDGCYTEFKSVGSKRYCCRYADGGLKLTVSGVPKKKGAGCLNDDIENFRQGFVFEGTKTGKLTHIYQYVESINENDHGDLIGDSVNLVPCDYLLDESIEYKIDRIGDMELFIQVYNDEESIL